MRARVFFGFVIVLELALLGQRWLPWAAAAPDGFERWQGDAVSVAYPEDWQPLGDAAAAQGLQFAAAGDLVEAGAARRLSVSAPIPVPDLDSARFFDVIRQQPVSPTGEGEVVIDRPVTVPGAVAAYRRSVRLEAARTADAAPATFHYSRVWVLASGGRVIEIELVIEDPDAGDPTSRLLSSVRAGP